MPPIEKTKETEAILERCDDGKETVGLVQMREDNLDFVANAGGKC